MVFGNGALGVEPREAVCQESKELAKFQANVNYVNVVTMTPDRAVIRSLGRDGQELDKTEIQVPALK